MLQTSLRKTVIGAAVSAAVLVGFAGSVQAKTVPVKWDPAYGGTDFPTMGWSGIGVADYDTGCTGVTGWVSNSSACQMSLSSLSLSFYDVADSSELLDTVFVEAPYIYQMHFQGGVLDGISSKYTTPVTSTAPIAMLGGVTPVYWHLKFLKTDPVTGPSVQLYWTKTSEDPACIFDLTCEGGSSQNKAILTVVPEPETYALMLAGLGVIGLLKVRRRR